MITIIIIAITAIVSILSFQQPDLMNKLKFNANLVWHKKEYFRLISHGFVHANWEHLIINMIVLFSFGRAVEGYFQYIFGQISALYYLILYFGGMLASNVYSLIKHKDDYYYNAVGASGAVSAVLFTSIFFAPWEKVYFFGVLPIPGIVFAILYLVYSYYMSRKNHDNVAHDAHFLGAVFGFIFPAILDFRLVENFVNQLLPF